MLTNDFKPNIAIHPGLTLKEILESISMSQAELAERTGLSPKTINEIIQGKSSITPETSLKLSAVFGMSAVFWNNLERNFQETRARIEQDRKIEKELPFLEKFSCYKELAKWGYVPNTKDPKEKVSNLLNFFSVSSLDFIQKTHPIAFRKSNQKELSPECLAAWLRCGEIEGNKIETKSFDREKFLKSIEELRGFTIKDASEIIESLQTTCAEFGVAVAFVPYFANTYVDGATRWLSADKALIQVSIRGAPVDNFWFTFFHEIAHLLKHGKKEEFVEFEGGNHLEEKEQDANDFATKTLIPDDRFQEFIKVGGELSSERIILFSKKLNISPAIVAGRLAYELHQRGDKNAWKRFSHLRTRLKFVSNKPQS